MRDSIKEKKTRMKVLRLTSAISSRISSSRTRAARTSRAIPHPGTPPSDAGRAGGEVVLLAVTETGELPAVGVAMVLVETIVACVVFAVFVAMVTEELLIVWCPVPFKGMVVMVMLGVVMLGDPSLVGLGLVWVMLAPVVAFM